jgi:hypothetical protein
MVGSAKQSSGANRTTVGTTGFQAEHMMATYATHRDPHPEGNVLLGLEQ